VAERWFMSDAEVERERALLRQAATRR